MFYTNLGGTAGMALTPAQRNFFNLPTSGYYWSVTEYSPDPTIAYQFRFNFGQQTINYKTLSNGTYAWAVRDGDSAPVPIPAAVWLFGTGLLALFGVRRKIRK
jgi:hypothetical protein